SSQTLPIRASTPPVRCVQALNFSPLYIGVPCRSVAHQRAEYLLGHAGGSLGRVLADARFLLGDDGEQPVERLFGDVAFDRAVLGVNCTEAGGLGGNGVVLLGDADLVSGL